MITTNIEIPYDELAAFCRKWRITELALFGSVLREDFRPDSDTDVLITREPGVHWPWGGYAGMTEDLERIFGRPVNLHEQPPLERNGTDSVREHVLRPLPVVYAA